MRATDATRRIRVVAVGRVENDTLLDVYLAKRGHIVRQVPAPRRAGSRP